LTSDNSTGSAASIPYYRWRIYIQYQCCEEGPPPQEPQHCLSRIILVIRHATRHLHINPIKNNNNPIKKNNVGFHCHYR
jgi:hypothetical protein